MHCTTTAAEHPPCGNEELQAACDTVIDLLAASESDSLNLLLEITPPGANHEEKAAF